MLSSHYKQLTHLIVKKKLILQDNFSFFKKPFLLKGLAESGVADPGP